MFHSTLTSSCSNTATVQCSPAMFLPIKNYWDLSLLWVWVLCCNSWWWSVFVSCYSVTHHSPVQSPPSSLGSRSRTLRNFWYLYLSTFGICNLAKKLPWNEWFLKTSFQNPLESPVIYNTCWRLWSYWTISSMTNKMW